MTAALRLRSDAWPPFVIGILAAAIAVAPSVPAKLALAIPLVALGATLWSALRPARWLVLFFAAALLTPPLPIPLGDSGVHIAPFVALLGLFAAIIRIEDWRPIPESLGPAFAVFTAVLLFSACLAALYSGPSVALGSLFRVVLFALGAFVFWFAAAGPRDTDADPLRLAKFLFLVAILGALFGCADFYYQFPAPAGFEPQFVWLDTGTLRRAQGLFYEASTFGNFCAFFLVMIAVALFRPRAQSPASRPVLALGGIVLAAGLILSYSRASVVNVLVACVALALVRRVRIGRALLWSIAAAVAAILLVRLALPTFSASYWERLTSSVEFFAESPNGVLSGRLTNWTLLSDFLLREPWHAVFGIGYKTLPYSTFAGAKIIADNTYLSLLAETGIFGLIAFLALNAAILRQAFRAARSPHPRAAFFGQWIFCFWVGEMVQMLSGDLITYWRVLPVYFCVLGIAVREAAEPA
jgi:O-antigen ligase